ncbi:MAG TPA: hypothetical protein VII43_06190 [Opitutaceae bacterium]
MSNWQEITLDLLNAANLTGVVDAMRDEAVARGMADPWPETSAQAVDELRACIGFSLKYTLDANTAAIPKGLVRLTLNRIVREMSRRVGRALSADERDDDKLFEKRLDQIRAGQWPIEPPDNPMPSATPPVQSPVLTPSIQPRRRRFTSRREEGY